MRKFKEIVKKFHFVYMSLSFLKFIARMLHVSILKAKLRLTRMKSCDAKENFIVSVTTFPARGNQLVWTLRSLLTQSRLPSKIFVVLSEQEYKKIPDWLLGFVPYGIEILWTEKNDRSYKKLLPIIGKHCGLSVVTVDDDVIYSVDMLDNLFSLHVANPQAVVCNRAWAVSYDDECKMLPYRKWDMPSSATPSKDIFPTGVGGVLYPATFLAYDLLNDEIFNVICPNGDDIWFWGIGNLLRIERIYTAKDDSVISSVGVPKNSLSLNNVLEDGNDIQLEKMVHWMAKIKSKSGDL